MPQIIVTAGDAADAITLRERINATDFDSDRFAANLIERIAWAVNDAAEAEERGSAPKPDIEPRATAETRRELIEA